MDFAQPLATKYQETGLPEPAYLLALPDDITDGSNVYAIQKQYDGEFSFDVFFESASGEHSLDGAFSQADTAKSYVPR